MDVRWTETSLQILWALTSVKSTSIIGSCESNIGKVKTDSKTLGVIQRLKRSWVLNPTNFCNTKLETSKLSSLSNEWVKSRIGVVYSSQRDMDAIAWRNEWMKWKWNILPWRGFVKRKTKPGFVKKWNGDIFAYNLNLMWWLSVRKTEGHREGYKEKQ